MDSNMAWHRMTSVIVLVLAGCGSAPESSQGPPGAATAAHHDVEAAFETNACPVFDWWLLLPRSVAPGASAEIDVFAVDPDAGEKPFRFSGRATTRTFSATDGPETEYFCDATGWQILTLTAWDETNCRRQLPLDVNCLEQ
jgi:hypothetical protein